MKFTISKSKHTITLMMEDKDKPILRKDIAVEGKIYVKGKPPSRVHFERLIELQCSSNMETREQFFELYNNSMEDIIEREAKELVKCYMRIRNAMLCIDLADSINLEEDEK